jgi:protein O-mannosyl-transferase
MAAGARKTAPERVGGFAPEPGRGVGTNAATYQDILLLAVLLLAVVAAYQPAWQGGVLWDDDAHITKPELRSWQGLWRIWFELGATQQYYPITHSAFWLQGMLWGDHLLGYHLVNIALHAVSAFLVVLVLRRLSVPGALLAGVAFALHPVQVESVAWMTELKNTLSGVFYFAAVLAYLSFDRSRRSRPYILAAILFVLALLSKSVTATLPAALLVVFWWQRGTISWRRDVLPLVPFFALAVAAGLTTAWVEHTMIGARGADFALSAIERFLIAGRAFVFYLRQSLWPANLVFVYPRWNVDAAVWWQYLYPASVVALLLLAWTFRGRTRAPLAALLYFGITLAPALGFVNVYPFRFSFVADHFQYLALVGVIALAAGATDRVASRLKMPPQTPTRFAAALLLALTLGAMTWQQSRLYADPRLLYEETLRRNPAAWLMHLNLGWLAGKNHSPDEAVAHYQAALVINPDEPQVHQNLGTTWMEMGRHEDALKEHQAAVRLAPGYAEAHLNLGVDLQHLGRYEEAESAYRTALDIKPGLAAAHYDLGVLLIQLGRRDEGLARVNEALRIQPDYPEARRVLRDLSNSGQDAKPAGQAALDSKTYADAGVALAQTGRFDEAAAQFREALRLDPGAAQVRGHLGYTLLHLGRAAEAERELRLASRALPDNAAIRANLGNALQALGRLDEAVAELNVALQLEQGASRANMLNDLGVSLARLGRMDEAVSKFQEAVRLNPSLSEAQANLAKALASKR